MAPNSPEKNHNGPERAEERLSSYTPAYQLGNLRDVEIIAASSGRSVEEILIQLGLVEVPDFVPDLHEWPELKKEG